MIKKIVVLISLVFLLVGCKETTENIEPISESTFMLGTVVFVSVYDTEDKAIFEDLFDRMDQIEQTMSKTIDTSEVSRINRFSETADLSKTLEIDPDVFTVIETALDYGHKSKGRFDITLAPIVDLWAIGTEAENVPEPEAIEALLLNVGLDKIKINGENNISLAQNTKIDLGGIAKGYAADEVADMLKASGVKRAIINLGGNVKVVGEKSEGVPFKVGIQDPLDARNNYLGIVSVSDKTIVTSGDYERFFEKDGKRYHHIFDPSTGYPYETNVASVTVISDDSIVADAMSTILYLMDVEDGLAFVDTLEGVDCIYVTKDYELFISNGPIKDQFELTNEAYKWMK